VDGRDGCRAHLAPGTFYADPVVGPAPLLLVLDGNSLVHRAYHAAATGRLLDDGGRPVWALKGLVGYIARAAAQLRPDGVLVGFDCSTHLARKADYPLYKAHRPDKPDDLTEQLEAAPELMREAGLSVAVPAAYEADDVLASAATKARENGWRTVVVTSDRDAFALVDATTSVLRIRNGGLDQSVLVTDALLPEICGVEAWQYGDFAALRGDQSDNLPGVRGFGSVTAAKLLAAFGSVEAAWAALDAGAEADVHAVVGGRAGWHLSTPAMRDAIDRNRRLMRLRTDLPLPELDSMRLPVNLAVMRRALIGRGINLGPSLWALTGGSSPVAEEHVPFVRPRSGARTAQARRAPGPGQLALF
jgi:DNA polymerase-1